MSFQRLQRSGAEQLSWSLGSEWIVPGERMYRGLLMWRNPERSMLMSYDMRVRMLPQSTGRPVLAQSSVAQGRHGGSSALYTLIGRRHGSTDTVYPTGVSLNVAELTQSRTVRSNSKNSSPAYAVIAHFPTWPERWPATR